MATTTRTVRAGFAFDTIIGVMLVTAGAYGAKWVISPSFWQSVDPGPSGEPVGAIQVRQGAVRVRSAGKSVWRDVPEREMVRQGDTVATGANGVADLVLQRKDRLRIAPESLVVVDVSEAPQDEAPPLGFGGGWFSKVLNTVVETQKADGVKPSAERTFLKVKKGSVAMLEAAPATGKKSSLKLEVGGKKLEAKASQAITVSADGRTKIAKVDTAKVEKIEAWAPPRKSEPPLDPARVENPIQGAVFKEGVPIPFGWAPPKRTAISQIEIQHRKSGKVLAQREFPGTGASLRLAQGEYDWRVRLRPVDSQQWTDWSDSRVVTVVQEIRKDEPVAVLQSKGGVPPQGRAALAARQGWRESIAAASKAAPVAPPPAKPTVARAPSAADLAPQSKAAVEARAKAYAEAQARKKAQAEEAAKKAQLAAQTHAARQAEAQKKVAAERQARAALQSAIIAASLSRQVAAQGKTATFDPDKLDRIPVDIAWGSVPGARSYRIIVYQGGKTTRQEEVAIPKYGFEVKNAAETVGLEYEITALMADGSTVAGKRSPIQVSLGSPNLVEPRPGSRLSPNQNSVFSWSRVALADRYEVQVAPDESFSKPIVAKAVGENFEFVTVQTAGNYFWRVRASAGPVKSAWSKPIRFTVR